MKSLENFNPNDERHPIINSPRSLEACRRQGIDPKELIVRSIADIKSANRHLNLEERAWQFKWQHHEDRRMEKLRVLLEERAAIIDDMTKGRFYLPEREEEYTPKQSGVQVQPGKVKKVVENKIRREQRIMEKQLDNELQLRLKEKQDAEREKKLQERQKQQQDAVRKKKLEHDQQHKWRESQKDYQEYLERKKKEEKEYFEKRNKEDFDKIDALRRKEERQKHKEKEFEQRLRMEDLEEQRREKQMYQEQLFEYKQVQLEMKERDKQKHDEERRVLTAELRKARNADVQITRQNARIKAYQDLESRRDEFEKRQYYSQERRRKLDQDRDMEKAKLEQEMAEDRERRQQIALKNAQLEEQRRQELLIKFEEMEDRKKYLDMQRQVELASRKEREQQQEQYHHHVRMQHEKELEERARSLERKRGTKDQSAQQVLKEKQDDLRERQLRLEMKLQDKKENVERIQRMQDYQRERLREEVSKKMKRADIIKQQKKESVVERLAIQREIDAQKKELASQMEKLRKDKIDPATVSMQLSKQKIKNEAARRPQSAKALPEPKPQFVSPYDAQTLQRRIEELKIRQNHDMLKVLEQEEQAEQQREHLLESVQDPADRRRLDKILGAERAKTQLRLQQMNDKHEQELQELISHHNKSLKQQ